MPRPSTCPLSSMTTALVVVDPRSIPTKHSMVRSLRGCQRRAAAFLIDHLEVALQTVLDVCVREITRIDKVGLDERGRLAGALLDFAHHQQLPSGEAVAALD